MYWLYVDETILSLPLILEKPVYWTTLNTDLTNQNLSLPQRAYQYKRIHSSLDSLLFNAKMASSNCKKIFSKLHKV